MLGSFTEEISLCRGKHSLTYGLAPRTLSKRNEKCVHTKDKYMHTYLYECVHTWRFRCINVYKHEGHGFFSQFFQSGNKPNVHQPVNGWTPCGLAIQQNTVLQSKEMNDWETQLLTCPCIVMCGRRQTQKATRRMVPRRWGARRAGGFRTRSQMGGCQSLKFERKKLAKFGLMEVFSTTQLVNRLSDWVVVV